MKRKTLLKSFITHNNSFKNIFRIMRVSLFLLFVCVCQLMATEIDAQNTEIKISRNNMTLRELIEEIEAQTDYLVVFRNQDVNLDQRISFEQKSGKIIDYLDEISEQIGLSFQFDNKYITVVPKNAVTVVNQEKKQVSGKIVDAAGIPISPSCRNRTR